MQSPLFIVVALSVTVLSHALVMKQPVGSLPSSPSIPAAPDPRGSTRSAGGGEPSGVAATVPKPPNPAIGSASMGTMGIPPNPSSGKRKDRPKVIAKQQKNVPAGSTKVKVSAPPVPAVGVPPKPGVKSSGGGNPAEKRKVIPEEEKRKVKPETKSPRPQVKFSSGYESSSCKENKGAVGSAQRIACEEAEARHDTKKKEVIETNVKREEKAVKQSTLDVENLEAQEASARLKHSQAKEAWKLSAASRKQAEVTAKETIAAAEKKVAKMKEQEKKAESAFDAAKPAVPQAREALAKGEKTLLKYQGRYKTEIKNQNQAVKELAGDKQRLLNAKEDYRKVKAKKAKEEADIAAAKAAKLKRQMDDLKAKAKAAKQKADKEQKEADKRTAKANKASDKANNFQDNSKGMVAKKLQDQQTKQKEAKQKLQTKVDKLEDQAQAKIDKAIKQNKAKAIAACKDRMEVTGGKLRRDFMNVYYKTKGIEIQGKQSGRPTYLSVNGKVLYYWEGKGWIMENKGDIGDSSAVLYRSSAAYCPDDFSQPKGTPGWQVYVGGVGCAQTNSCWATGQTLADNQVLVTAVKVESCPQQIRFSQTGGSPLQQTSMGTFVKQPTVPGADRRGRPIYENSEGKRLYYWAGKTGSWLIGDKRLPMTGQGVVSAGADVECPHTAKGWKVLDEATNAWSTSRVVSVENLDSGASSQSQGSGGSDQVSEHSDFVASIGQSTPPGQSSQAGQEDSSLGSIPRPPKPEVKEAKAPKPTLLIPPRPPVPS